MVAGCWPAIAGVDSGFWDVMGRSLGVPIHRLLGGVGRETLSAYASSIMVEGMDETRLAAEQLSASKFKAVKLKVAGDLERDLERVGLVQSSVRTRGSSWTSIGATPLTRRWHRRRSQIRYRVVGGATPPA